MNSRSGFTLLEMMIVLVIMATLTVFSSQSLQQAIRNKVKIQQQVDDMSQVRDTLKVIERDLNLAFHYTDLEMEFRESIKKKRVELSKAPAPAAPGTPPKPPPTVYNPNDPNDPLNQKSETRVDPTTHFVGRDDEMFFATLNSGRISESEQMADFIKVGYALESCKIPGKPDTGGSCLVRKTSNIVEGDISRVENGVALLTEVTEFKLRYLGKGKQDWVNDWNSLQGDAVTKNRFPDAVEVSLAVEKGPGDKKKKISMQIIVPIRFPNNERQDQADAEAKRQTQNPGGIGVGP